MAVGVSVPTEEDLREGNVPPFRFFCGRQDYSRHWEIGVNWHRAPTNREGLPVYLRAFTVRISAWSHRYVIDSNNPDA